jgi:hypothetical protein
MEALFPPSGTTRFEFDRLYTYTTPKPTRAPEPTNFYVHPSTSNIGQVVLDWVSTTLAPDLDDTTETVDGQDNVTTTTMSPDDPVECPRAELLWIKLGLMTAILVCLIILIIMLCVTLCYYFNLSSNAPQFDLEQQAKLSSQNLTMSQSQPPLPVNQASDRQGSLDRQAAPVTQAGPSSTLPPFSFKRLSVSRDQPRPPLTSSLNGSTFSAHMAPPSPRSMSTEPGVELPDDIESKKNAFDKIEQEEAKRHVDLALMAERSSSLAKIGEQLKAETTGMQAPKSPAKSTAPKPIIKKDKKQRDKKQREENKEATNKPNDKIKKKKNPSKGSKGSRESKESKEAKESKVK